MLPDQPEAPRASNSSLGNSGDVDVGQPEAELRCCGTRLSAIVVMPEIRNSESTSPQLAAKILLRRIVTAGVLLIPSYLTFVARKPVLLYVALRHRTDVDPRLLATSIWELVAMLLLSGATYICIESALSSRFHVNTVTRIGLLILILSPPFVVLWLVFTPG